MHITNRTVSCQNEVSILKKKSFVYTENAQHFSAPIDNFWNFCVYKILCNRYSVWLTKWTLYVSNMLRAWLLKLGLLEWQNVWFLSVIKRWRFLSINVQESIGMLDGTMNDILLEHFTHYTKKPTMYIIVFNFTIKGEKIALTVCFHKCISLSKNKSEYDKNRFYLCLVFHAMLTL